MTDDPWLQFMQSLSAPHGHSLADIHKFDSDQLESTHTFIQWLFPLPEPSAINPEAPALTALHCEAVGVSSLIKKQVGANLDLMLGHWGVTRQGGVFSKAENFELQSPLWVAKFDHNHLRITRVLAFLTMTGFKPLAERLCLFMIARLHDELFNRSSAVKHWQDAVTRMPPAV